MDWRDRIVAHPDVLVGKPVIKGTIVIRGHRILETQFGDPTIPHDNIVSDDDRQIVVNRLDQIGRWLTI